MPHAVVCRHEFAHYICRPLCIFCTLGGGGGHWKEYKNINYSVQFLAFSCKKDVNLKQTSTAKL